LKREEARQVGEEEHEKGYEEGYDAALEEEE
jgi:hypothetical protein